MSFIRKHYNLEAIKSSKPWQESRSCRIPNHYVNDIQEAESIIQAALNYAEQSKIDALQKVQDQLDAVTQETQEKVWQALYTWTKEITQDHEAMLASIEKDLYEILKQAFETLFIPIESKDKIIAVVRSLTQEKLGPQHAFKLRCTHEAAIEIKKNFPELPWEILEDNTIEPETCILEAETGILKRSFQGRAATLLAGLKQAFVP